jgi:Domain of unknown function (DUF4340)
MREKRNKILTVSLLLLVCILVGIVFIKTNNKNTLVDKNIFNVPDSKVIDRIQLLSLQDTVTLTYNSSRWLVNDIEQADRGMIDVLFATIVQAEPKRLIKGNQADSLLDQLNKSGVTVSLYQQETLVKQFLAGGNKRKTQAYFKDETNQVYAVNIPGYRVYTSGIFEQTSTDWFDKFVFAFNWVNFKKLTVHYPSRKENNFEVQLNDRVFKIAGLVTDTTKLNDFLDAVSFLTVDEYAATKTDSVDQHEVTITVTDLSDRSYTLNITTQVKAGKILCFVKNNQPAWIDARKLIRLRKNRQFFAKSQ